MRTLSGTLIAAQQSDSAEPYLRVQLVDREVGVPRLRWERWYAGVEAPGPCAAALPADGSLLRARIEAATGALLHSRVAAPGSGSTYSAWTSLGTAEASARLGLAAAGTRALLATVRTGGLDVEVRESTDSGATFGAPSVVATASGTVTAVACSLQANGSAVVLYAVAGVVYVVRRSGTGAWLSPAAWPHSLASVSSLAAALSTDHQVLVAGVTSTGEAGVWSSTLGAGVLLSAGSWASLGAVADASAGTSITYLATGIGHGGAPRAVFTETYSGGAGYARTHVASALLDTSFYDRRWRDARPVAIDAAHGSGFAGNVTSAWLVTTSEVWHAALGGSAPELSDDVLEAELVQTHELGRARLVLRNDDGRYASDAAPQALAPGGELLLSPGYVTSEGVETSGAMRCWITAVRRRVAHGRATVEVDAVDGWGILEAWDAPRQLVWAAGAQSAAAVLSQLCARAGLLASGSGMSAEATAWEPAYTVRAGERGVTAFRRLLAALPDLARMGLSGPLLYEPAVDDDALYAYGVAHAITSLRVDEDSAGTGWARVFGDGVFAEAVDDAALRVGAGVAVALDRTLAVQARAEARAASVLRKAALARVRGELVALPHVGQEVGDVIEVTSDALGLAAERFRVSGVRRRFARTTRAQYEMTLDLGAV